MKTVDLITSPVFTTSAGTCTLPGLLARLSQGDELDYLALQAHQAHLWHAFVVQLACVALLDADVSDPPKDESTWATLLLDLHEDPSTWWMEQEDPSRPAFLQPPAPDGLAAFKNTATSPDLLGLLATAKNHDVKRERIREASVEHWIYALVSLQTGAGFMGRGNYGVYRMNGGFASRPVIGFYPSEAWPMRFRTDVQRITSHLAHAEPELGSLDGTALLWTVPWSGKEQVSVEALHPLCVEVARRVRVIEGGFRVGASSKERTNGKVLNGNVHDPWIPVLDDKKGPKALNVSARGFDYKTVAKLITNGMHLEPYMVPKVGEPRLLICEVLAGEQGQTAGFHRRTVRVPAKVPLLCFRSEDASDLVLERTAEFIDLADRARRNVLLPALLALYGEDPKQDGAHRDFIGDFTREVDAQFFEALFAVRGEVIDQADYNPWKQQLASIAKSVLDAAIDSAPTRASRSWLVRGNVLSLFHSLKKNHLSVETPA